MRGVREERDSSMTNNCVLALGDEVNPIGSSDFLDGQPLGPGSPIHEGIDISDVTNVAQFGPPDRNGDLRHCPGSSN